MKKITAWIIISFWLMLWISLIPVLLIGGLVARFIVWINQQFKQYLDSVFRGLE